MSARGRVQAGAVTAAIVVLLGLLALTMMVQPAPAAQAQSSAGCYRQTGGDKWICQSGGEMEFQSGSTLDVQSGATGSFGGTVVANALAVTGTTTVGGQLSVSGALAAAGNVNLVEQAELVVTAALTPTLEGGVQPLSATGTVTTGEINPGTPNQVVTLVNVSNSTINIPDSGAHRLAGAAALGQWDTLTLWYRGTVWVELSRSDN